MRTAAVRALESLPEEARAPLAAPLLTDTIRSVRIEAARLLAGRARELLQQNQKAALDSAVSERIESELISAERPESHMNLGLLYTQMGRMNYAENELKAGRIGATTTVASLAVLQDRQFR